MTLTEFLMIVAIFCGPITAVQIQKFIEWMRQKRLVKENIFKTLMSTRGTPISLPHVQSLNLIDLEFYGNQKKNKKVVDTWTVYRDHLYSAPQDTKATGYFDAMDVWTKKKDELLVELLFEMAQALGYSFDKVLLKKGSYTPQGYIDNESAQVLLREGFVSLLEGKSVLPVQVIETKSQSSNEEKKPQA